MNTRKARCPVVIVMAAMLAILGCERKFTRNRFEMINIGVSDKSVVELALGKPVGALSRDLWRYSRSGAAALIRFDDDGVVQAKRWVNRKTGEIVAEP